MSVYDDARQITTEILGDPDFRQDVIELVKITPGNGTPDNPGTPTEVKHALSGVAKGASWKYMQTAHAVAGDLDVTVAPLDGVSVGIGDFIDVNSLRYKIVQDNRTPAAGTTVVWKFVVRRGG